MVYIRFDEELPAVRVKDDGTLLVRPQDGDAEGSEAVEDFFLRVAEAVVRANGDDGVAWRDGAQEGFAR